MFSFCVLFYCVSFLFSYQQEESFEQGSVESSVLDSAVSFYANLNSDNNFLFITPDYEEVRDGGVYLMNLPAGFPFYKAMPQTMLDNDSLVNSRAGSPSWLGDMETAMRYTHKSKTWNNLEGSEWDLHAYKTVRPVKLLLLSNHHNIKFLYSLAKEDLHRLRDEIQDLESKIHDTTNNYSSYQRIYLQGVRKKKKREKRALEDDILSFKVATGFNISWENQLEILKTKHISGEKRVEERKKSQEADESRRPQGEYYQLNRISFDCEMDTAILRIINRYLNVDGYYNPKVHSLWHLNQSFREEVAFGQTRGVLGRDYSDPYDWSNKETSKEYKEAYELTMESFLQKERASFGK